MTATSEVKKMATFNFEECKKQLRAEFREGLKPAVTIREMGQQGMITATTIRYLRSNGDIPAEVFFKSPKGIMVITDPIIDWFFARSQRG